MKDVKATERMALETKSVSNNASRDAGFIDALPIRGQNQFTAMADRQIKESRLRSRGLM